MTAITILSISIGICGTVFGIRRNNKQDDKADATQITTVIVKLENITKELLEIKNEFRTEIKGIKVLTETNTKDIIRIDESLKSCWNVINEMKGNFKKVVDDDNK